MKIKSLIITALLLIVFAIPVAAPAQVVKAISRVSIIDQKGKSLPGKSFDPAVNFDGNFITFVYGALVPKVGRFEVPALRLPALNRTLILNTALGGGFPDNAYPLSASTFDSQTKSSITADGRYIAFANLSSNLVEGDTNGLDDIFVKDVLTNATIRASVSASGAQANSNSSTPRISANGVFVTFASYANNLVDGDSDSNFDIFVKNILTGAIEKIDSPLIHGFDPSISGDGRFVTFSATDRADASVRYGILFDRQTQLYYSISNSRSTISQEVSADGRFVVFQGNDLIIPGLELNQQTASQVYLYEIATGNITLMSVGIDGKPANSLTGRPSIDATGRLISYVSFASNLVAEDTNNKPDIFVRETASTAVIRVSLTSSCVQSKPGGAFSGFRTGQPVISGDGKKVLFTTRDRLVTSPIKVQGFSQVADKNSFEDVYLAEIDFDTLPPVFDPKVVPQGGRLALNCVGTQPTIFFPEVVSSKANDAKGATAAATLSDLKRRVIISSVNGGVKQEVRRLLTKRNELTIKGLPAGKYEAKFRQEEKAARKTIVGKFSKSFRFEITQK